MTKALFDAVRQIKGAALTQADVDAVNAALAPDDVEAPPASPGVLTPSPAGVKLMHDFEGCRLQAYADPGSDDGHPWTIGWGSTGPGIAKGVVWTQQQADDRFAADLAKFAAKVRDVLGGAKTTGPQFDAMVSLAYNIGVGAFSKSTVLRKHRAGDYPGAQAAFAMWNKNDGAVMAGLTRRRAAEAARYGAAS
jgi:GH24 family phage-related lysozyme (muramidase)